MKPGVARTVDRATSDDPLTPGDRARSPRVVVAEYQSVIRMDLAETLQAHGYQVVAQTGSFAETTTLTLFLQPDLLVLDRALITAAGDDPIDRIQRTQFPLAVLETCYVPSEIASEQRSGGRVYLPKPFAADDLIRATEQALTALPATPEARTTRTGPPADPRVQRSIR